MRRLLIAVLLTACIGALTAGTGSMSQYVQTMTFQNGVAPTAGYAGCASTWIGAAAADTNLNHGACDSLLLGSDANVRGVMKTLIKFDIGDLPDSAVIVRARLYLYTLNPSGSSATADPVALYRVFRTWNEGTGTCAGTAQAANSDWGNRTGLAWITAGMAGTGSTNDVRYWGPGTSTPDSATVGGSFFGADSINTAKNATAASTADMPAFASAVGIPKSGTSAARRLGWTVYDVTGDVRQWHIGAIANNGWVEQMIPGGVGTVTISKASDNYTWIHRRPKLVVEYLDPEVLETAGGGSVRRTIGRTR